MKKVSLFTLVFLFCFVSLFSGCASSSDLEPPNEGTPSITPRPSTTSSTEGDGMIGGEGSSGSTGGSSGSTGGTGGSTGGSSGSTGSPGGSTGGSSGSTGSPGGSTGSPGGSTGGTGGSTGGTGGSTGSPGGSTGGTGGSSSDNNLSATSEVYIRSIVQSLNVRSAPSTDSTVVGSLDKGDMVIYLEREGEWYKTYYKHNIAYVSAAEKYTEKYTMKKSGTSGVEDMLAYGYKSLGVKYVFGAERLHYGNGSINSSFSKNAFDCSSLTQYMVFYGLGKNIGTTTRSQVVQGQFVEKSNLQRGDLMFFTNSSRKNNAGIERVGHVAVYLGGNYILHTSSDHAVIEEISSTRWEYYIESRRF